MSTAASYPARVDAELDPGLSRWLWLVKWILAIPHYVVLAFLWTAFVVLSVVAFFAILFTGRYPRSIFEFNVGVMRWSWRVAYYTYGALGTDRYPPFTLAEAPDYPAHLDVAYPERLSRGLVLVKWWLLAIPHYLIVGVLMGGGSWLAWRAEHWQSGAGPGLIGILVLVAAVVLAVTGRYPTALFDLLLGLNRWVVRVAAYAGLMTDQYPPFRLDMGGGEPGGPGPAHTLTVPPIGPSPAQPAAPGVANPAPGEPLAPSRPDVRTSPTGWTSGRIVALVIGVLLALVSLGFLAGGGATMWADRTQRDTGGFLTTSRHTYSTGTYALTTRAIDLRVEGPRWIYPSSILGTARVRVLPASPSAATFVGIARTVDVDRYLTGVGRAVVTDLADPAYRTVPGTAPADQPADQSFWAAATTGPGERTLTWKVQRGSWTIVVMNAGGRPGLNVSADVGATVPRLVWIAAGLLIAGGVLLLGAGLLIGVPIRRAARAPR